MKDNMELELYKLIMSPIVDELGWINDKEFCVWIPYIWISEFLVELKDIFGFDNEEVTINMQHDYICIELNELFGSYVEIEDVFPKDQYKH